MHCPWTLQVALLHYVSASWSTRNRDETTIIPRYWFNKGSRRSGTTHVKLTLQQEGASDIISREALLPTLIYSDFVYQLKPQHLGCQEIETTRFWFWKTKISEKQNLSPSGHGKNSFNEGCHSPQTAAFSKGSRAPEGLKYPEKYPDFWRSFFFKVLLSSP